jgi:acetyl esterase
MPLDPLVKAFLDRMAAIPRPKLWELPPALARQSFAGMMGLVGPKDVPVGKIDNFTIPGPAGPIRARAYAPVAGGSEAMPALVYFHGGSFVVGGLESHDGLCRLMAAEAGLRVIAVDYRLAPEHVWPAALDDAIAAAVWIGANAAELGVDAGRIAVGGDSAGGLLATAVTQEMRAQGGLQLGAQMLLFPATQMGAETASLRDFGVGYFLDRRTLDHFYGLYLPAGADRNAPRVSPLRAKDFSGLPPAYVMLAGYDPLHDEGLAYAEKLRAAGVKVMVADYPGMVHGFVYLQTVLPEAREALAKAVKAVKTLLEEA